MSDDGVSIEVPSVPLADQRTIPQLGFGTYKIAAQDTAAAVRHALEVGYRHIDTAQMYANEAGVGQAIAESGLPREDLWITTKLDNPHHRPADVDRSMDASLTALGLDAVDLFLIHWPLAMEPELDLVETWRAVEALQVDGRTRSIGVSNFHLHHLATLADAGCQVPAVNQVEVHPWLPNNDLRAYAREQGICIQAWSPLGRGAVLEDPVIAEIAQRVAATPAQVVLRWHLDRGDVAIPKSATPARIEANLAAVSVALSPQDVQAIDSLDRGEAGRQGSHPDTKSL